MRAQVYTCGSRRQAGPPPPPHQAAHLVGLADLAVLNADLAGPLVQGPVLELALWREGRQTLTWQRIWTLALALTVLPLPLPHCTGPKVRGLPLEQ